MIFCKAFSLNSTITGMYGRVDEMSPDTAAITFFYSQEDVAGFVLDVEREGQEVLARLMHFLPPRSLNQVYVLRGRSALITLGILTQIPQGRPLPRKSSPGLICMFDYQDVDGESKKTRDHLMLFAWLDERMCYRVAFVRSKGKGRQLLLSLLRIVSNPTHYDRYFRSLNDSQLPEVSDDAVEIVEDFPAQAIARGILAVCSGLTKRGPSDTLQ